jgi:ribonuclease HII
MPDLAFETEHGLAPDGSPRLVAGVDEAGRGPWAGPVMAAAVILDPARVPPGLDDSKKLGAVRRAQLADAVRTAALAWSVAEASVDEIDTLNILAATHLAMRRAVEALAVPAGFVLVDGNRAPKLAVPVRAVVGGDGLSLSVAAASILAKTVRDTRMEELDRQWPGYGFAAHKGYGVAAHAAALARLGPCPAHRRSFKPVAALLAPAGN